MIALIISILSYVWRAGATNDPEGGNWPRLIPAQALGPRLAITAFVVLGLLNFLMILRTFKKYGRNSGSFVELSPSHQMLEGGVTSSVARGRGLSGVVTVEPQASSLIREGSDSVVDMNEIGKGGAEHMVITR